MLVRMKTHIGGFRNGVEWPDTGTVIEIVDHEAADLIAAGYAEEAPADATAEFIAPNTFADPDGGAIYESAQAPADEPVADIDGSAAGTPDEIVDHEAAEPAAKPARRKK